MKTIINELTIKNFKSIKEVKLDCKQVNIFIGKPNTGKSNILEAISLLSGDITARTKFLEGKVYYEKVSDLFNMLDTSHPVSVECNIGAAQISFFPNEGLFGYFADNNGLKDMQNIRSFSSLKDAFNKFIEQKGKAEEETNKIYASENALDYSNSEKTFVHRDSYFSGQIGKDGLVLMVSNALRNTPVRSYHYKRLASHSNPEIGYLVSPHGDNLLEVLQHTPKLQEIIVDFFKPFGFEIVLVFDDPKENKIKIQKKSGAFHVQLPYSLVADTLQRMIFHLAAIYSNRDSVILFEEPESHTYAPYQSYLASEIIEDNENQYFITTHSDNIFDSIVRENPEKTAVFVVNYKDGQTVVKKLTDDEITNYLNNYISIFQNLDGYTE